MKKSCSDIRQVSCETLLRIATESKSSLARMFQEVSVEPEQTEKVLDLDINQDLQARLSVDSRLTLGSLGYSLSIDKIEQELIVRILETH